MSTTDIVDVRRTIVCRGDCKELLLSLSSHLSRRVFVLAGADADAALIVVSFVAVGNRLNYFLYTSLDINFLI